MNANKISPDANARISRIKVVSRIFRVLIGIGVVIFALIAIVALLQSIIVLLGGRVVPGQSMTVRLTFSPSQTYVVPSAIPLSVQFLGAAHLGFLAFGVIVLNRLFKLYEHGSFFAVGNVRYIKILGLVVAGNGLVQTILEFLAPQRSIYLNQLAFGLLIMLIAWIMDEGRKIQEEQELTV